MGPSNRNRCSSIQYNIIVQIEYSEQNLQVCCNTALFNAYSHPSPWLNTNWFFSNAQNKWNSTLTALSIVEKMVCMSLHWKYRLVLQHSDEYERDWPIPEWDSSLLWHVPHIVPPQLKKYHFFPPTNTNKISNFWGCRKMPSLWQSKADKHIRCIIFVRFHSIEFDCVCDPLSNTNLPTQSSDIRKSCFTKSSSSRRNFVKWRSSSV